MEKSIIPSKTFVLKTNIHCSGCEKKMKKLLQNIKGVHTISIDADQGKVTISGTTEPKKVLKLLEKAGQKSELFWEPTNNHNNLQILAPQSKSENNYHGIHDKDMVKQLQQISEIKGLKSVELTTNGLKLTFKEQDSDNNFRYFNGYGGTSSARNSSSTMHNLHDFCGHHETCCGNSTCSMQCCNGCRLPPQTPCRCMNSQGSIPLGLPWPGNVPSAPPEVVPEYYDRPPPPAPVMANTYYSTFSDENPTSCRVM